MLRRLAALAALLALTAGPPVVAAPLTDDDRQLLVLAGGADRIVTEGVDAPDRAAVLETMIDSLRGADAHGRAAAMACETAAPGRLRSNMEDWARPLAAAWDCARQLHPDSDAETLANPALAAAFRRFDPTGSFYPNLRNLGEGPSAPGANAATGLTLQATAAGTFAILRVMPRSPAAASGIAVGDRLTAIDGVSVQELTLDQVIERLRGAPDSPVRLTLLPQGGSDPVERPMRRAVLNVNEASARLRDGIVVIGLYSLGWDTPRAVGDRLRALPQGSGRPRAILLDLRGGTGGLLDSVVAIADLFVDRGTILTVVEARRTVRYDAHRGDDSRGLPLYILVDRGTSSGSEAMAAALSDLGRGRILGERTMGVGEIHTAMPLIATEAWVGITTGRMVRLNGARISEGVMPDIPLEVSIPPPADQPDPSLDRAIAAIAADLERARPTVR